MSRARQVAAAPVLFLWGIVLHWKRWRLKRELAERERFDVNRKL